MILILIFVFKILLFVFEMFFLISKCSLYFLCLGFYLEMERFGEYIVVVL